MPSYAEQLQDIRNPNSIMGALSQFNDSIGNAYQNSQVVPDTQAAMKFFMKNPVSPESIQEFQASHPQMPLVEIYKTAGAIQSQKKYQGSKDASMAAMNFLKNTDLKSITPEVVQDFIKSLNMDPSTEEEFVTKHFPKVLEIVKSTKPEAPESFNLGPNEKRFTRDKTSIGGKALEVASNPVAEKMTPLADAIKAKMLEVDPDTTEPYTAAKAYSILAHPVTPKDDLVLGTDGKYVKKEVGVAGYVKPDVHSPERFQQEKDLKAAGRQPTPPEIKPGAALKRMSAIKSAIARLNSGGSIDALLLAQIPEYAGLMASNDPEARKEAITQLQAELDYVKGFAPKGAPSASEVKPGGKILDKKTAMAIFEKAGRNKALAEKMAREQGYTF